MRLKVTSAGTDAFHCPHIRARDPGMRPTKGGHMSTMEKSVEERVQMLEEGTAVAEATQAGAHATQAAAQAGMAASVVSGSAGFIAGMLLALLIALVARD